MTPKIIVSAIFLMALHLQGMTQSEIVFVETGTINVNDRSIEDWNEIEPVAILTPDNQWKSIRGEKPVSFTAPADKDLSAKVFLTWDGEYLYCAMNIVDDRVIFHSKQPWSGDSGEIFFVGENLAYDDDFHNLIEERKVGYGSSFQVIVNGVSTADGMHISEWRTYRNLKTALLKNKFSATGWETSDGWIAEVRIPLKLLTNVLEIAKGEGKVKIGFDILDYDHQPLPSNKAPHWGYKPENIISNSSSEKTLATPIFMSEFVFQNKK